jgi:hypothetical protein
MRRTSRSQQDRTSRPPQWRVYQKGLNPRADCASRDDRFRPKGVTRAVSQLRALLPPLQTYKTPASTLCCSANNAFIQSMTARMQALRHRSR